jgi:type II secretory pathway pseudopilin PulG
MSTIERKGKKEAFTIIELLVVMSVIVVLMGMLLPAMNMVRRYSKKVSQYAQFHAITSGLDMFRNDMGEYPDSDALDEDSMVYCGAMRLAEALAGQDLVGFHPSSHFRQDGGDGVTPQLYYNEFTFAERRGPYIPEEAVENIFSMQDVYGGMAAPLLADPCSVVVLCDEFERTMAGGTGLKFGMPILYYRANISNIKHIYDPDPLINEENIYNSNDNQDLIDLGLPWMGGTAVHPMATSGTAPDGNPADPYNFYKATLDRKLYEVLQNKYPAADDYTWARPRKADTYILISAGYDGLYGSRDDIFNWEEK